MVRNIPNNEQDFSCRGDRVLFHAYNIDSRTTSIKGDQRKLEFIASSHLQRKGTERGLQLADAALKVAKRKP